MKKWLVLSISVMFILLLGAWIQDENVLEDDHKAIADEQAALFEDQLDSFKPDEVASVKVPAKPRRKGLQPIEDKKEAYDKKEVASIKTPAKPKRKGINPFGEKKEENSEEKETKVV